MSLLVLLAACGLGSGPAHAPPPAPAPAAVAWIPLAPGLERAEIPLPTRSFLGDSTLRVVRVAPSSYTLELGTPSPIRSRT